MAALRSLALLLAGLMVLHPGTGGAQTSPGSVLPAELRIFRLVRMTPLLDRTPEQITQDAFASEYGQAVVTETARVFETSADAECLRSNRIQAREWAKSAREIFLRYGAGF